MSGSFPPHILPKPANSLPLLAPKPSNIPGQAVNGSGREGSATEIKRENGNGSVPRMMGMKYLSQDSESVMRRTSQRKRPKVCCPQVSPSLSQCVIIMQPLNNHHALSTISVALLSALVYDRPVTHSLR